MAAPRGGVIYRYCDFFLFFFSFSFFSRDRTSAGTAEVRLTDFRAKTLKRRGMAQGGAFWGRNFKFLKFMGVLPQKVHRKGRC